MLIKALAGKVTPRKADGNEVTLTIDRVNKEDQEWLRQRAKWRW